MNQFPDIPEDHFLVFATEAKTGIFLNWMGAHYQDKEGEGYLYWIFDSLARAEEFARYQVDKRPDFELTIVNSDKELITVIRK